MSEVQSVKPGWSVARAERMLTAADGVPIYATVRGEGDTAVVVAHGFSGGHRHGSHARLLGWFARSFTVVAIDQRGHGRSGGSCTLSHHEVLDVDAAVAWARELGAKQVITVGFSMGSSSVLRHAALSKPTTPKPEYDANLPVLHSPDAVVGIGGAAQWWYRGSRNMWLMHVGITTRLGREFIKRQMKVRIGEDTWPDENSPNLRQIQPIDPVDSIRAIAPLPVLIVQGTKDDYFPVDHGQRLFAAASDVDDHRATLWVRQGMAHAEGGTDAQLVAEICDWIAAHAGVGA